MARGKFSTMTTNNQFAKPPQSEEDFEAEGGHTANARVEINTGGYASVTHRNGVAEMSTQKYAVETARNFDDSFVEINGMTTKREVYERLVQTGALPKGAKVVDYAPHKSEEVVGPFDASGEGDANLAADTDANTDAKPKADPAVEAVFKAGQAALDTARNQLGAEAVDAAVQDVMLSGELAAVPSGVSPKQVEAVVAAYTASAVEMIADKGISIGDLSLMLDDADLKDARLAVVSGNTQRVQELAGKATDNLASLPVKDPDLFSFYIDNKFPDLDWKVEQGRALVSVEGKGYVPWDSVVRMGWLARAKAVAQ